MKFLLLTAALAVFTVPAYAQVTSSSQTQVQSGAQAGASNAGVTNVSKNVFEAGDHMKYDYGHQRIEAVAPIALGGAAAGFSNENCANTAQGAAGTFWASLALSKVKESIRCNARRDAGVYVALAADADASNNHAIAAKLRSMAIFQKCTATEQEIAACKQLGLIDDGGHAAVNTDPYRSKVDGHPMGIDEHPAIDKSRTPAARDSGWIDPTHNP